MPTIGHDRLVRSLTGDIIFSLNSPRTKQLSSIPMKKRIESQFQDKRTVYCVTWLVTIV